MIFREFFFSKQTLLRDFQMAQQIAASPAIWILRLAEEYCGIHQKNWANDPGRVWAPAAVPTMLHKYFAAGQEIKKNAE
jgi:hypothetical protein